MRFSRAILVDNSQNIVYIVKMNYLSGKKTITKFALSEIQIIHLLMMKMIRNNI